MSEWKKKREDDAEEEDEFFGPAWGEFERMRRQMDAMFSQAMRGFGSDEDGEGRHYVYGFNVRVGPDGIPRVQQFGNVKPLEMLGRGAGSREAPDLNQREPLTDVIEADDSFCVTLELPGVDKSDIDMTIESGHLVIDVDTAERKYHKSIPIPDGVDAESPKATYKNGILDVSFTKLRPKKKDARRVKIE